MWPGTSFKESNFQRILCKKESKEASVLIWTNFDSFAITCLIQVDCFKNFIEVVLNSLQTQKGLELVFTTQFL